ncbi:MAG: ABC transporter ATP-binding protein [Ardenticatenia bacterium]|nr:ABC transporter ATP-binding protein [Ardenticatenia bacterium]
MIHFDGVTFTYDGATAPALQDLRLDVSADEFVLVLGPAGSGKSTLLRCLNGLIPHRIPGKLRGRVTVAGRDVAHHDVYQMAELVGLVFQDPEAQFVMLYVEDEVAFGLENLCYPRSVMWPRVRQALEQVGLTHKLGARLDRLSGGEKQKVALASVLAMHPRVLALDAPTAHLDPKSAHEFWGLMRRLRATGGRTIIAVEHRVDELLDVADRLVVLDHGGQVVLDMPPRHVGLQANVATLRALGVWVPQVWELAAVLGVDDPAPATLDELFEAAHLRLAAISPSPEASPGRTDSGTPPLVRARKLSYTYPDGTQALHDITLDVQEGDFCALVGRNGAGKTTLARLMAGVLVPPPGTLFLAGRDLAGLSPREIAAHVGYVFQNPEHQFVATTLFDELAYSLRVRGVEEATVRRRVFEFLERFGLDDHMAAHPFELSRSQQRLLSVAAVLIAEPRLLILDEPTLALDRTSATALMDHLRTLNQNGTTILLITHDMQLVAEYVRTAVVMARGDVLFHGPVHQLFGRPDVLEAAALRPPLAVALSLRARAWNAHFPLLLTASEWDGLLAPTRPPARK